MSKNSFRLTPDITDYDTDKNYVFLEKILR